MGEEGEIWRQYREFKREKKASNMLNSLNILKKKGYEVQLVSAMSVHYRVGNFNYWPTTGSFYNPETMVKGRGVMNLIIQLEKDASKIL